MDITREKTVLLFYKEYERDRFLPYDRYLKRAVRPAYNLVRRNQSVSGFYVWYQSLIAALEQAGYRVERNNYDLARRNPDYPVGLVGYPLLLNGWHLPNPAVLGPGLFDHPNLAPDLMKRASFRTYLVTCQWMEDLFAPVYGRDAVRRWFGGIDLRRWPDLAGAPKSYDLLIYDKIRWNREIYEPRLLQPVLDAANRRGLRVTVLRYGQYQHAAYRELLAQSRAMIFLCEHETQGMAYQEAMACNVPLFAWDQGYWLDPRRPLFDERPIPATSVPYFSEQCGMKFRDAEEFERDFDTFLGRLHEYTPREYVRASLSMEESARIYLESYQAAGLPAMRKVGG